MTWVLCLHLVIVSKESGDYVSMKGENLDMIRNYNVVSRKLLDKHFRVDIKVIIYADKEQNIVPSASMGGVVKINTYFLVSRDLINARHFDLDTSVGISVFNERIIAKTVDWFFISPNTTIIHPLLTNMSYECHSFYHH